LTTPSRRTPPKGRSALASRRVPPPRGSFLERNRRRLLYAGLIAVIAVGGALVYASFTTKGYVCLSEWTAPSPAPTVAPSATPHIGYFQDDLGRTHVPLGTRVRYAFCPPASGQHYNAPGVAGPIEARFYASTETTIPQNWIHNMEHGGMVLLYRCGSGDNCDQAQQDALRAYFTTFPNSPICNVPKGGIGPVITRFDDMAFPYAALLWDQILPLDSFQPDQVTAFFLQNAERTNPEQQCAAPTPTPGPTDTPAPTDAPVPTGSPAASGGATTEPSSASSPAPSST
jgi:hypothetical protein